MGFFGHWVYQLSVKDLTQTSAARLRHPGGFDGLSRPKSLGAVQKNCSNCCPLYCCFLELLEIRPVLKFCTDSCELRQKDSSGLVGQAQIIGDLAGLAAEMRIQQAQDDKSMK